MPSTLNIVQAKIIGQKDSETHLVTINIALGVTVTNVTNVSYDQRKKKGGGGRQLLSDPQNCVDVSTAMVSEYQNR